MILSAQARDEVQGEEFIRQWVKSLLEAVALNVVAYRTSHAMTQQKLETIFLSTYGVRMMRAWQVWCSSLTLVVASGRSRTGDDTQSRSSSRRSRNPLILGMPLPQSCTSSGERQPNSISSISKSNKPSRGSQSTSAMSVLDSALKLKRTSKPRLPPAPGLFMDLIRTASLQSLEIRPKWPALSPQLVIDNMSIVGGSLVCAAFSAELGHTIHTSPTSSTLLCCMP